MSAERAPARWAALESWEPGGEMRWHPPASRDRSADRCPHHRRYEEKIASHGGIKLFLAGIGPDGHIAFNEPGSSLSSRTRVKTLAQVSCPTPVSPTSLASSWTPLLPTSRFS